MSTLEARFRAKVDVRGPDDCWPWTASVTGEGYGSISLGTRAEGNTHAHRVAYLLDVGPLPVAHDIHHRCGNRRCCNPAHLEALPHALHPLAPDGIATMRRSKSACPQGHPYDDANTYVDRRGKRYCRLCGRDRMRARRAA